MPTPYVKNKMAEASLLNPSQKGNNFFSVIVGCFFLIFLISGPRYIEQNKPIKELEPEVVPQVVPEGQYLIN